MLAERLKKKDAPGRFFKTTTENRPFFKKDQISVIRKRTKINNVFYNWISFKDSNKIIQERFQRQ